MSVVQTTRTKATLDDLYNTPGKAELINGRIEQQMATGVKPSECASNIYVSLRMHAKQTGRGRAFNDNLGYAIAELPSGRESFSPDASYYDGPLPQNLMRFVQGSPNLGVEVRSENDYGPGAEPEMEAKRSDYFAAGTQVVWDVDPLAETVAVYRASSPSVPTIFHRGSIADAEPAVPGWSMSVDDVFES
jgi:Uma2 family endonuclease